MMNIKSPFDCGWRAAHHERREIILPRLDSSPWNTPSLKSTNIRTEVTTKVVILYIYMYIHKYINGTSPLEGSKQNFLHSCLKRAVRWEGCMWLLQEGTDREPKTLALTTLRNIETISTNSRSEVGLLYVWTSLVALMQCASTTLNIPNELANFILL